MAEGNITYNEPAVIVLEGTLDKGKFETIFQHLVKRHESFRTSFELHGGETIQEIHDSVTFAVEYFDISELRARPEFKDLEQEAVTEKIVSDFIKPFDLSRAPLLRVGLIEEEKEKHVVVVDMHHIITDGTSHRVLIEDFMTMYKGEELPGLPIRYKDFSQWQNRLFQTGHIKKQEDSWLKEFQGEVSEIDLPLDYPRPPLLSFEGNRIVEVLGSQETGALKKMASQYDATLYMLLLARYNTLLFKLCGQEDIVCGTLIAGRRRSEFQRIIGMFVNTLALRTFPTTGKTFREFFAQIRETTLNAYENQDYQFEILVEKVVKNRDTSRNPLFDVLFILQNLGTPGDSISGLWVRPYEYKNPTSKFDLKLESIEQGGELILTFEYRTKLFKEETIRRFIRYYKVIISTVLEHPGITLGNMDIISGEEKEQLLYIFNDSSSDYPGDKTLYRLFTRQVERTPDYTALVGKNPEFESPAGHLYGNSKKEGTRGLAPLYITYRELNERSHQLARLLMQKGVKPDTIAGIMLNRSLEAVVGILGILEAGGAYLPIDPDYPEERINFMLADSEAKVLLAAPGTGIKAGIEQEFEQPRGLPLQLINLRDIPSTLTSPPTCQVSPANLAYIIYTSGSTGKPKGVMVEHRNIVNYTWFAIKNYVKQEPVNFPLFTSLSFDLTVTSIFTPLLSGNTIVVYEGESKESLI
jgi:non-ribosomal peptide synthetase component F